jgi:hypothetical protein
MILDGLVHCLDVIVRISMQSELVIVYDQIHVFECSHCVYIRHIVDYNEIDALYT